MAELDSESVPGGDGRQRALRLGVPVFEDRTDAGRRLAALLERYRHAHPVVVGIPRGGVPVAAEVAHGLAAPLEVTVVRKVGAPQNPEYALGALAEGGVLVLNERSVRAVGLTETQVRDLLIRVEREASELTRRYRGSRQPTDLTGRTAILVDDGLATGRSAQAAVQSLRMRGALSVVVAVPVAAAGSVSVVRMHADEVVCLEMPRDLWAVGYWYEDFQPVSDEEVMALLH